MKAWGLFFHMSLKARDINPLWLKSVIILFNNLSASESLEAVKTLGRFALILEK